MTITLNRYLKKTFVLVSLLMLLALGLNLPWLRAASVYTLNDHECDPAVVLAAQARVETLFGSVASRPLVVCLDSPRFGLGHHIASTYFAPWMPSVAVLAKHGQSVDVMAHEWGHAEIAARAGFIQRNYVLPTWFDEGLAMQLDQRTDYSLAALKRYQAQPELIAPLPGALSSPSEFFQPGTQGKYHYAYARCVVASMLSRHRSALELLEAPLPLESDIQSCVQE